MNLRHLHDRRFERQSAIAFLYVKQMINGITGSNRISCVALERILYKGQVGGGSRFHLGHRRGLQFTS